MHFTQYHRAQGAAGRVMASVAVACFAMLFVATHAARGNPDGVPEGHVLIEGDIILTEAMQTETNLRASFASNPWPGGIVPYAFHVNVSALNQQRALDAMAEWEARADVSFIPRTTEIDYILVRDSTVNSSYVGRIGGEQNLNMFSWTYRYIIAHELAHALGFWHEQSRADRDQYIEVNYANIEAGFENNFDIRPNDGGDHGPYDFGSIMHYPGCAFSTCGGFCNPACATIRVLPQYGFYADVIGQRARLSDGDAAGMAFLYGFSGPDCNANHVRDQYDIDHGLAFDCNSNAIPDACEADCDANGILDACDISAGTSVDSDTNGVPDACDGAAAVLYVDASASGADSGLTWTDAFNDLQSALTLARAAPGVVEEIWVAAGTYKPAASGSDREGHFDLVPGVDVYGGFAATETARDERDPRTNPTVLSGDLDGDDGPGFANRSDNAFNVIVAGPDVDAETILDGFIVRGGAADGAFNPFGGSGHAGGGLFCNQCALTMRDCAFEANMAGTNGAAGAIYVFYGQPAIERCRFDGNRSGIGGAIYNDGGFPRLLSCLFTGNEATVLHGGGITSRISNAWIMNSTFIANHAPGTGAVGGGIAGFFGGTTVVHNSIAWDNVDDSGSLESSQIGITGADLVLGYSCVEGLSGALGGTGNTGSDPLFADEPAGDYRLAPHSPCIDAGTPGVQAFTTQRDLDGHARMLCGAVDLGAYESGLGDTNCDGAVNASDYAMFATCMTGPNAGPYPPACTAWDAEFDTDIDLQDFAKIVGIDAVP